MQNGKPELPKQWLSSIFPIARGVRDWQREREPRIFAGRSVRWGYHDI